jgi:hypothetical protein
MSNSLARKVERQKSNKIKKGLNKQIKHQVSLFKMLPTSCSTCAVPFDKSSKEHHLSWEVKVYEKEGVVFLKCPECRGESNE